MSLPKLSQDILIHIVHSFIATGPHRTEWVPLRLVSRLFNQQLLIAFFVLRYANSAHYEIEVDIPHNPLRRFSYLVTSWWLQGLLKCRMVNNVSHTEWMATIRNGIRLLDEWIDAHPATISEAITSSRSPSSFTSSDSPSPFRRTTEVVCNALICHLGPLDICRSIFNPGSDLELSDQTAAHIVYLAACYMGDLLAVEHFLTALDYPTTISGVSATAVSGLYVALIQGHQNVAEYLLALGLDPNTRVSGRCGLDAAAQSGNVSLVELLLGTKYETGISGMTYEGAIMAAIEHPDPVARMVMIKPLFAHARDIDMPIVRARAVYYTTTVNDPRLAEWIIDSGPIMFYDSVTVCSEHPLLAAINYRNLEIVRLILGAKCDISDQETYVIVRSRAFNLATVRNFLDAVVELLPLLTERTTQNLLWRVSRVENGLEAIDKLKGPLDFNAMATGRDNISIGTLAFRAAVRACRPQNVKWLLSQGVRTKEPILVYFHDFDREKHSADIRMIEDLLRKYQNPGLIFDT